MSLLLLLGLITMRVIGSDEKEITPRPKAIPEMNLRNPFQRPYSHQSAQVEKYKQEVT